MSLKNPQGPKAVKTAFEAVKPAAEAAEPAPKTSKRKALIVGLKAAVSVCLLYFVLKNAGVRNVIELLRGISPLAFAASVAMYLFSTFISTIRWKLLLPEGFRKRSLFGLYLIGSFFNTFLPGLIGGDAVKAYYLYKDTGRMGLSLASVFMDRYIGFVALMMLGLFAFPFGVRYFRGSWVEWALPLIVLAFIAASIIFFGLRLGKRFSALREMYEHFDLYRGKRAVVFKVFVLALFVQLVVMASVYVLSLGLGLRVSPLSFVMFLPIITTVAMLPISVSGIGPREAAFVLLFGFVGVSAEAATALSFAWFLSIAIGGLPGLVFYLRRRTRA